MIPNICNLLFNRGSRVTRRTTTYNTSHTTSWVTSWTTPITVTRTTSGLTYYTTSWNVNVPRSRTTSRTTSKTTTWYTSWNTSGNWYYLASITSATWSTGWRVGDIATVTGNVVAPNNVRRQLRVDSVDANGRPVNLSVRHQGGYLNSHWPSGGFTGPRGVSGTWTGGKTALGGTYTVSTGQNTSRTTSWTTSYTTSWTSARTTSKQTSHSTSWSTNVSTTRSTSATTYHTTTWSTSHVTFVDPVEERTAYILVIGQSNVANYGVNTFTYTPSQDVKRLSLNTMVWEGAVSPAPTGSLASGTGGNMDGLIGDKLITSGKYERVRIVNVAVGGTELGWWVKSASPSAYPKREDDAFTYTNGRLYERLEYARSAAESLGFSFSHVLLHIGESDGLAGTTGPQYISTFNTLKENLRELEIHAPIILGKTSYVTGTVKPVIINAQTQIISENSDVYEGPNTDTYGSAYRYDNLHFNANGLDLISTDWVNSIPE